MAPSYDQLRVRLIQIRMKPDIEQEEQKTFRQRCRLRPDQLHITSVFRDVLDERLLHDVDAVLIGGAGAYSVTQTYDWTPALIRLIHTMYARHTPLFGSCWGHQIIARALDGKVIFDLDHSEMGCKSVYLTKAGQNDPLFGTFPHTFKANMGHQDRVSVLPDEAIELATNDTAPFQAFRIQGRPIYCTQFHTELNAEAERQRLFAYRDHYPEMQDETLFQATLNSLEETTEVDHILPHFLETFAVHAP